MPVGVMAVIMTFSREGNVECSKVGQNLVIYYKYASICDKAFRRNTFIDLKP